MRVGFVGFQAGRRPLPYRLQDNRLLVNRRGEMSSSPTRQDALTMSAAARPWRSRRRPGSHQAVGAVGCVQQLVR